METELHRVEQVVQKVTRRGYLYSKDFVPTLLLNWLLLFLFMFWVVNVILLAVILMIIFAAVHFNCLNFNCHRYIFCLHLIGRTYYTYSLKHMYIFKRNFFHIICRHVYNLPPYHTSQVYIQCSIIIRKIKSYSNNFTAAKFLFQFLLLHT